MVNPSHDTSNTDHKICLRLRHPPFKTKERGHDIEATNVNNIFLTEVRLRINVFFALNKFFKRFRWHCIVRSRCRGIFIVALMLLFHWCLALFSIVAALSIVLICKWHWLLWQMVTFCRYNAGKIVTGKTGQFNDDTKPFKFKQNLFFQQMQAPTLTMSSQHLISTTPGWSHLRLDTASKLLKETPPCYFINQFNDKTSYMWVRW